MVLERVPRRPGFFPAGRRLSANAATQRATVAVTNQAWRIVRTGDFDGDGRTDVFWRNGLTGANVVWRSANPTTQQAVAAVADPDWQPVAAGDFNGDGKTDVFWRKWDTGANVIWLSANAATSYSLVGGSNLKKVWLRLSI